MYRILTGPGVEEGQSSSVLSWGLLMGLALIQKGLSVCRSGQNALEFSELTYEAPIRWKGGRNIQGPISVDISRFAEVKRN